MAELDRLERRVQVAGRIRKAVEPTAVSLFSGAGGLDLGLAKAGWRILAQVEADGDSVGSLKAHTKLHPRPPLLVHERIEDVPPDELRRSLGLRKGQLTLLAGGPPCQPFTTSGLRQSINDARAVSLFPRYLEFVEEFRPKALLIENVDGLLSAALSHRPLVDRGSDSPPLKEGERKGSFLKWLLEELADFGYSLAWGVAEAADHGVPQMRQRAIIIGIRDKSPCYLPAATFGMPGARPYRTLQQGLRHVKDLGAVQPLSDRKLRVYAHIPPGGNWRNLPEEIQRETMGRAYFAEGGRSGWWRRLDWNRPAATILGMPDHSSTALVHPEELRCLSVNECAAIQTFPVGVAFSGSSRSQYQQIGNAVPPLLATRLGTEILEHLGGLRKPSPPHAEWRRASSNRRVGTHGWAVPNQTGVAYTLNVAIRPDHIWANLDHVQALA
jgi:DNA (cytosine-5)-methyltransferase 1